MGLRPYQRDAIAAVDAAVAAGQHDMLLAVATGTGMTRLAIALMYELLRHKRFRRILFLVDRNALGRQTRDAMSTTEAAGFLKFDEVFPVADLARKFPEATNRVQVATVQAMIRRVFDDPEAADRPTSGTYDLITVDEAHRGYTLDAELREDDLGFRSLDDYLSAYRRVLDYFDATRVALAATPALHTREIFGPALFRYGYRLAVIDGYLIDHRTPPHHHGAEPDRDQLRQRRGGARRRPALRADRPVRPSGPSRLRGGRVQQARLHPRLQPAVADVIAHECPPGQRGKTLLFAARDDHADILVEELRAALTEQHGPQPHDIVEKITGSVDRPLDRIKAFKNDPRPKYVVTVDLLTTGIDVPAITTWCSYVGSTAASFTTR